YFDGSRYVSVPDSVDFDLSSYTIDSWVKVPDGMTTGWRQIISQDDGTNYWRMRLEDNKLVLCDSRLTPACSYSAATINDGEWHHVAVVRDGVANQVILYIDGVADNTVSTTGGDTAHNIATTVQIGRKYSGTEYFYGMIDEIAVYNRALTLAEVKSRYRAPIKVAFTSDPYFGSGIQAGDKVIIRFHGKTNGSTINPPIDASNINTVLQLSSGSWLDGAGQIGSAVWSTYKFTDDTLTITLSAGTSAPTIASGATITVNGTYIKDIFNNAISDSITLSKDFDFNLPEGAVSYWTLNSTNNDSFGQNNIVTNTGTAGACKFGNCYTYGASQYASINNSYSLNPERLTVEAWVNPGSSVTTWNSGVSGTNVFFFYSGSSARLLGITGSATVRFNLYIDGAWRSLDYTPSSISGWHHYVGTYDGTTSRLYIDGVEVNTLAYTGVINQFDTGAFYLAEAATGYTPNISIDDVAIYSRALDATEVLGRYGDYTVTAIARDTSNLGPGIQAGDTVTIKFSGPTNAVAISVSNIENVLALSNAHYWRNNSGLLGTPSPTWSSSVYENDTLIVTLSSFETTLPDVAPQDTITIGSPIGSKYRAFTKSAKIGGLFGDALPTGKLAYWTFNEQSGTTAYDSIGNNHGTLNNSFWRKERLFKGLYFDGSRYVSVPDSVDFDLSS
ncbi:MAG: LamG-like jellyroll fold domain-containing protein, partial [Nitrospinota bacterium]